MRGSVQQSSQDESSQDESARRPMRPGRALGAAALILALAGPLACAGPAPIAPGYFARVARPGPEEAVVVDDLVLVFDASGSIDRNRLFPQEKSVLEAFVSGMPPGRYRVALRVLGGNANAQTAPAPFHRGELARAVRGLKWTGEETPLAQILTESAESLAGGPGRVRLVIFSDGLPTRYGRYLGPEPALAPARLLAAEHGERLCFHTIQLGDDPRGPDLMDALAKLTPCGSSRQLDELGDRDALFAFQQIVFNGPAPPPEPARARTLVDLDRDGVDDRRDRCARTPLGAEVDERGCWVIDDYVFESGSARLRKDQLAGLDRVLAVLAANPGLRVRLDGHTDNTGTAEFNFGLARRRAEAIRLFLSDAGIDPDRLQIRSFGPTRPIASHDTAAGRQKNRRVELSVLDRAPAGAGPGLVSGP